MSRLLAALAACLAATAHASSLARDERENHAQILGQAAAAAVAQGCLADDSSCNELSTLLTAYHSAEVTVEDCQRAATCPLEKISGVLPRLAALDVREVALPEMATRCWQGKRAMRRYSLMLTRLASFRLAELYPQAPLPSAGGSDEEGAQAAKAACAENPEWCAEVSDIIKESAAVTRTLSPCFPQDCQFETLDAAGAAANRAFFTFAQTSGRAKASGRVFPFVRGAVAQAAFALGRDVAMRVAALEARTEKLGHDVAEVRAGTLDPAVAESHLQNALRTYRKAFLDADRLAAFDVASSRDAVLRDRVNVAAAALARVRGELAAAKIAGGIKSDRAEDAVAVDPYGGEAAAAVWKGAPVKPAAAKAVPPLPAPPESTPEYLDAIKSLLQSVRSMNLYDADFVATMHRIGLTKSVGDPAGRAALVHSQTGNTCAIVSQQEVLEALHLEPTRNPAAVEARLRETAQARGFYRNGTPMADDAELLIDRGVIVNKRDWADFKEFDAAVRRGGFVIAGVDARYLWNRPAERALGHAVLITGAEVNRLTGETLGYYYNDSGRKPPERSRFINVAKFELAWKNLTSSFTEVL